TVDAAIGADGLQADIYVGDTGGNGNLNNGNDASLLTQSLSSGSGITNPGLAAYRNLAPMIVDDLIGTGLPNPSTDASDLLPVLSGGSNAFVPLPPFTGTGVGGGRGVTPLSAFLDPRSEERC